MEHKTMKIITTDYNSDIYWRENIVPITPVGSMNVINVYPEITGQEIEGFGGAFTESSGYNYAGLDPKAKAQFLQAYFTPEGLNYQLGRTHINSCDFALSNYAAVSDEADREFKTFTLEREKEYILPLIKDALQICGNKLQFILTPWSPPAFMKTNGEMNNGGRLKAEHQSTWARYIARYIKEMQAQGLDIQYLTVQNEPAAVQTWDSCCFSAEEEMEFVRDYLGPTLESQGLSFIKILIWDHNKEIVYERASTILADRKAASYIYGIAVHWYTGDHFEGLSLVKDQYPDKQIFFTEGCIEFSRFKDDQIGNAEMYAHDMIGDFNHGLSAFLDWNLLLDANGGPNHAKNYCAAPIMCTSDKSRIEKKLSYYYIGHFSRYIQKGARHIAFTKYCSEVEVTAFQNPDGQRVLVLLNRCQRNLPVTIREQAMGTDLTLKPNTIATICY